MIVAVGIHGCEKWDRKRLICVFTRFCWNLCYLYFRIKLSLKKEIVMAVDSSV